MLFADKNFLGIAFDSGGVTTGPMTVPFILALGLGVSNVRSDKMLKPTALVLLRFARLVLFLQF